MDHGARREGRRDDTARGPRPSPAHRKPVTKEPARRPVIGEIGQPDRRCRPLLGRAGRPFAAHPRPDPAGIDRGLILTPSGRSRNQRLGQRVERGGTFGHAIGARAPSSPSAETAPARRDVDDPAPAPRPHMRRHPPGSVRRGRGTSRRSTCERRLRPSSMFMSIRNARVVHQHVNAADSCSTEAASPSRPRHVEAQTAHARPITLAPPRAPPPEFAQRPLTTAMTRRDQVPGVMARARLPRLPPRSRRPGSVPGLRAHLSFNVARPIQREGSAR